ncbi:MAG: hypothetical protein QOJ08_2095 [Ilumatobacteraceae bacterium]
MKSIVAGLLAPIAAIALLSACGDDVKLTAPPTTDADTATDSTIVSSDVTIPPGATIPAGAIPSDASIPEALIDQMIAQFEAAGMKVDKACFTALLQDESLRKMVEAGGTPNQETIQKFFSCLTP